MQNWYIDQSGRKHGMPYEVPVDGDDQRTPHRRHQCTHQRVVNGGGKERCPTTMWLLSDQRVHCQDHGNRLAEVKEPSRPGAVAADVWRMYGRAAAPWAIPAAAAVADTALALAQLSPLEVALTAPALASAAWWARRQQLTADAVKHRRIEKGQKKGRRVEEIRRRARAAGMLGAEAGVWATVLSGTDLSTWPGRAVAAAGMLRWAAGSVPWWAAVEERRNRGTTTPANDTPAVKVDVQAAADQADVQIDPVEVEAVSTWATRIGCPGGPLSGTELIDFQRLPGCDVNAESRTRLPNWVAKVVAKQAGTINMREQRPTLRGRIAAAYHCTYADVSFTADEADLSVAWVRVQPDNVLAETKMWPGPGASDWKRGRSTVGPFDDGDPIHYQWWTKGGAAHDLISGCTGSGKSELVAQLLLASLHSQGLVIDWVGDPQGGQSYGALKDAVDWFARDKTEITFLLLAALKEMYRRNDELARNNIKTWQASTAMPLLVLTLDEVQSYIDDPTILELVEKLVGQGRKCGIKMRLITQIPAAYNLGGSTYIKEQLKAGQSLIFRAMTDIAGRSATDGDCPIDPTELPVKWGKNTCAAGDPTAGLMFVQGVNGRDVYGRAYWTGDNMDVWLVDYEGQSTLSPGVFGLEAQMESGPLWGDRKERAKRAVLAGRSDADLLSGGKALELLEQAAVSAAQIEVVTGSLPGQSQGGQQPRQQASRRVEILDAARAAVDDRGLITRDALMAEIGGRIPESTVRTLLTGLVEDGTLRRIRNGLYELDSARV